MTFNEKVNRSTIDKNNFSFWKLPYRKPVTQIPITTVADLTTPPNSFLITPSIPIQSFTTYATVMNNQVTDLTGNPAQIDHSLFRTGYDGKLAPTSLRKKVAEPSPDTTGPVVATFTFALGKDNAECKSNSKTSMVPNTPTATFSEAVTDSTITTDANVQLLMLYGVPPTATKLSFKRIERGSGGSYNFVISNWPYGHSIAPSPTTSYVIVTNNRVTDTNGNPSPGDALLFFLSSCCSAKIADCCCVPLPWYGTNPANGATNVTTGTRILVSVNRFDPAVPIDRSTMTTSFGIGIEYDVTNYTDDCGKTNRTYPLANYLSGAPLGVTTAAYVGSPAAGVETYELIPSSPLVYGKRYVVYWECGGWDTAHNKLGGGDIVPGDAYFMFDTVDAVAAIHSQPSGYMPALVGARITAAEPGHGKWNVRRASKVFFTLPSYADPATVTTTSVWMKKLTTPSVGIPPTRVSLRSDMPATYTFEYVPSVPLVEGTTYALYLTNRVQTTAGLPSLPDSIAWFTQPKVAAMRMSPLSTQANPVQKSPDTTGPKLYVTNPPVGKCNVRKDTKYFFTFDESVMQSTILTSLAGSLLFSHVNPASFTDLLPAAVTTLATPANAFQIAPSVALSAGTTYALTITDNIRDLPGNPSPGTESYLRTSIDFSKFGAQIAGQVKLRPRDFGPFILWSNPGLKRTNIQTDSRIIFTLTKAPDASTLTTGIFFSKVTTQGYTDLPVTTISPLTTPPLSYAVIPSSPLTTGTTYGIFLANTVTDPSGHHSPTDEIYFDTNYTFRKLGVPSSPPVSGTTSQVGPRLIASNPTNGRANVPINTRIILQFDKGVNGATVSNSSIRLATLTTPPIRILPQSFAALSGTTNAFEMLLSGPLTINTSYAVFVNNRLEDTLGFPSPGGDVWFTTNVVAKSAGSSVTTTHRSKPLLAPGALLSSNPADLRFNIRPSTRILMTFNGPVSNVTTRSVMLVKATSPAASVTTSNITTLTTPANSYALTFPSGALQELTTYEVQVSNLVATSSGTPAIGDEFAFSTTIRESQIGTENTVISTNPMTGPLIGRGNPATTRVNIQAPTRIILTLNRALSGASMTTASIAVAQYATPPVPVVATSITTLTTPAISYELLLSSPLTAPATYVVALTNHAEDTNGHASPGDELWFETRTHLPQIGRAFTSAQRSNTATTPASGPILMRSNPSNGAVDISTSTPLFITFNTSMDATSLSSAGAVILKKLLPLPETTIGGTSISKRTTGPANTFLVRTSAPLSVNTTYGLFVTNRALDTRGRACPGDEFRFNTAINLVSSATLITTATTSAANLAGVVYLTGLNPAPARENVRPNTRIYLTFNEPVDSSTLSTGIQLYKYATPTAPIIGVSQFMPLTNPANTWDIVPSVPLQPGTTYLVSVSNNLQALNGDVGLPETRQFDTRIAIKSMGSLTTTSVLKNPLVYGPTVSGPNPGRARLNILPAGGVFLTFNTKIQPKSLTTTSVWFEKVSTPTANIGVARVIPLTWPANTWELVPSSPLSTGTTYGVFVTNIVRTPGDLHSPGDEWNFSTQVNKASLGKMPLLTHPSPNTLGPQVRFGNPANGSYNVQTNSQIIVTFDESINGNTLTTNPPLSTEFLRLTTPVVALGIAQITKATTPANSYIITPSVALQPSTTYAVIIDNMTQDLLGNHSPGGDFYFSTSIRQGGAPAPIALAFHTLGLENSGVRSRTLSLPGVSTTLTLTPLWVPPGVTRGGDMPLVVMATNGGLHAVAIDSIAVAGAGTGGLSISPSGLNPHAIPPDGHAALSVNLTVGAQAPLGPTHIDITVNGHDVSTGLSIGGGCRVALIVEDPAHLVLTGVDAPGTIVMGSTAHVAVDVANDGHAPLRLGRLGLAFATAGTAAGGYTVTVDPSCVVEIPAGQSARLVFEVAAGPTVKPYTWVHVAPSIEAFDSPSGRPLAPAGSPETGWIAVPTTAPSVSSAQIGVQAGAGNRGITAAFDGIRLFVPDPDGHQVLVFVPTGPRGLAQPDFVLGPGLGLVSPVAASWDGRRLLLVDTGAARVLVFEGPVTDSTATPALHLGNGLVDPYALKQPMSAWSDGERLYVADTGNGRVLVYRRMPQADDTRPDFALGQTALALSTDGSATCTGTLQGPSSVAGDGTHVFVAESRAGRVLMFDPAPESGTDVPSGVIVLPPPTPGDPMRPAAISAGADGLTLMDMATDQLVIVGPSLAADAIRFAPFTDATGAPVPIAGLSMSGSRLFLVRPGGRVIDAAAEPSADPH